MSPSRGLYPPLPDPDATAAMQTGASPPDSWIIGFPGGLVKRCGTQALSLQIVTHGTGWDLGSDVYVQPTHLQGACPPKLELDRQNR